MTRIAPALMLAVAVPPVAAAPAVAPGLPADDAAAAIADIWAVPPVVASHTRLPAPPGHRVAWSVDGRPIGGDLLVNDAARSVTRRVTGTIVLADGVRVSKTFTVRLLGRGGRRLLAYARRPSDAHDANQPAVAHSLHLALGTDTAHARPLNGNYGTVFARGDYVGIDRVALRGLTDPSLFYFADGSLGVIAVRVAIDGTPACPGCVLLFKAEPAHPAEFVELGTLDLGARGGVVAPMATWDSAAHRYRIGWRDRDGRPFHATARDLSRTEWMATPLDPERRGRRTRVVAAGNVGPAFAGPLATGAERSPDPPPRWGADRVATLPVEESLAAALANRFDRIANISARVPAQVVAAGHAAALAAVRVTLGYSDGSQATRAVDWDASDLHRVAAARHGRFTVHGRVRQRVYPRIFAYNRADPAIVRYTRGGRTRYLFVATDDTGNDNVGSVHLPIRVAGSIAALADDAGGRAREIDLLNRRTRRDRTAEGRVIAGCYWAPELHVIGGRLSILFAPCFNPKDASSPDGGAWYTVQAHIMQLRDGGDPARPDDWSAPAAIRRADGSPLGRAGYASNISLDMSFFAWGGRSYYIWSQRYLTKGAPGDPLTWIAPVDPAAPTRLLAEPRPLIAPSLSFEENLAEGGFVLRHRGRLTVVYSGSGVSPTYVVGGIQAREGADPMAIDSWRKWSAPLQKSVPMPPGAPDYRAFEQGPGHGSFTTDEDGNTLYVYHTWGNGVGGDGRDARVRRLHWAADGRPILDMTPDEEVAPAHRAVTMRVTVRPAVRRR